MHIAPWLPQRLNIINCVGSHPELPLQGHNSQFTRISFILIYLIQIEKDQLQKVTRNQTIVRKTLSKGSTRQYVMMLILGWFFQGTTKSFIMATKLSTQHTLSKVFSNIVICNIMCFLKNVKCPFPLKNAIVKEHFPNTAMSFSQLASE